MLLVNDCYLFNLWVHLRWISHRNPIFWRNIMVIDLAMLLGVMCSF